MHITLISASMNTSRGFTLIELLIVIAIIGILSSVVIGSVNSGRDKGVDATVKSDLGGVRAQAELIYNDDGNYNAVCGANSAVQNVKIAQAIEHASSTVGAPGVCGAPASGDAIAWAISSPLKNGQHWCVDSAGTAKEIASALELTDTVCP